MKSNNTLYMKRPASWPGDPGREATYLGNGFTGALVTGGAARELILLNRADLWHDTAHSPLPRLDGALQKTRELLDAGDYYQANDYMWQQLEKAGYLSWVGCPFPLGCLEIRFRSDVLFSDYRRNLHMDKAECEITYNQKEKQVTRRCFVSRRDDTFYYEYVSNQDTQVTIDFGMYDDGSQDTENFRPKVADGLTLTADGNGIDYAVKNDRWEYGAKLRVYGAEVRVEGQTLQLCAKRFRIAVKCCSGRGSLSRLRAPADFSYEEKLAAHLPLHRRLYNAADISLGSARRRFNEDLLDEAYMKQASPELLEKMWRFGRYLYICGTHRDGLPMTLTGLWHSGYRQVWPSHTANENVQIINWHADVGGLSELVRPLIHYLWRNMDIFRENADKIFGCRGIYVGAYFSPANNTLNTNVPVILNFTGVAGWLAQHFYRYYRMTGDRRLLEEKIMPFMLEAADFYLDYVTYGADGKILYYPGVSPENTPLNLKTPEASLRMHDNPVTKNPVIEIAIVKELFTNLITLIHETKTHEDYLPRLTKVLADLPPYLINRDGALREWATPELEDEYAHRHVSHIYPLFPGEEIAKDTDPVLYAAIERAVDLRELGAQCNWSLAHMACIYATLERGDRVLECLDSMLKGCTMNNLVTLSLDHRNMGVTYTNPVTTTVQLDGNMGAVNAVQKMLIDERRGCLLLLPAPSQRLSTGSASRLRFSAGEVDLRWDFNRGQFRANILFRRDCRIRIRVPGDFTVPEHGTDGINCSVCGNMLEVTAQAGSRLVINSRI